MLKFLKNFLAAVDGTKKGILVPEELIRSIITSLGSGSLIGLVLTVLTTIQANTALIFPNPAVGSVATVVITLVIDLLRRLNHGPDPVKPA
jgi:hypothetical protein